MSDTLQQLTEVLQTRKAADADASYVASLHQKGLDAILKKVGEEATEVVLAAKGTETGGSQQALVNETADLWFHCMVMLSHLNLSAADVLKELERRFDTSGHAEKAARKPQ